MNNPEENQPESASGSPHPSPDPAFSEGQKLAGVFVLRRELEAGAGERIWLAHDEILGKDVSLHFIPAELRGDERAMGELRAEIKRNRQLIHPGILRVYDLIEESGWAAISMDWFEGESLASLLRKKGSAFRVEETEPWLRQLCQTLDGVHKVQIYHRNLTPANLFVDRAGKLLVAKFGVSRAIEEARGRLRSRSEGPDRQLAYLSPQQLDGESPNRLDDIYGLGATFYELLTGDLPFAGADLLTQIRRTPAPALSQHAQGIPAAWDKTLAACLAKNPEERPQSAGAVAQSLGLGTAGAPLAAHVAAPPRETVAAIPAAPISPAPEPKLIPEPVRKIEEPVRETRKAPPVAASEQDETEPLDRTGASEIYPELSERRGGFPVGIAAVVALLLGIVGAFVYFSRRPAEDSAPARPVNEQIVADEPAVKAPPELPFATPAPKSTPPPAQVAAHEVKASPAEKPAGLVPGEPTLVDEPTLAALPLAAVAAAPVAPVASAPVTGTVSDHGPKLSSNNNTRKASPTPAREAAPVPPAPAPSLPLNVNAAPSGAPVTAADLPAKQAALERARAANAEAEKAYQDAQKKRQSSEAALAAAQKGVDDKTKAMAPVVKAAEELQAERKKREESASAAASAARDARQAAEEQMRTAEQKARQAEDAKKAFTDWELLNKEKLSGRDRADAELQTLKTALADKQQSAEALAKAVADADAARQQQLAAIEQANRDIVAAQLAAEAERKRQLEEARAAAKAQAQQELAEMQKRMQELMIKMDALNKADGSAPPAPAVAPAPSTPSPAPVKIPATPVPATPLPVPPPPKISAATPPATPAAPPATPMVLALSSTPMPLLPPPSTPAPATPAPATAGTDKNAFENSLGLKFAPVGDVLFAIWPTRVQDFEIFAQEANVKNSAWRTPGFKQGANHPVVNVSWIDAMAFCRWLTDKEHKKNVLAKDQVYRLPTDLEWSRGVGLPEEAGKTPADRDMGVPDVFPWGTQWPPPPNIGNYTGEETGSDVAIKGYDDGFAWTSPVGTFPPNKYGLYDMGGNVWQWCMDTWSNDSKSKVLRGASWYNGALKLSLLSSCRVKANPESSTDNYGFRIVRATDTSARRPH